MSTIPIFRLLNERTFMLGNSLAGSPIRSVSGSSLSSGLMSKITSMVNLSLDECRVRQSVPAVKNDINKRYKRYLGPVIILKFTEIALY